MSKRESTVCNRHDVLPYIIIIPSDIEQKYQKLECKFKKLFKLIEKKEIQFKKSAERDSNCLWKINQPFIDEINEELRKIPSDFSPYNQVFDKTNWDIRLENKRKDLLREKHDIAFDILLSILKHCGEGNKCINTLKNDFFALIDETSCSLRDNAENYLELYQITSYKIKALEKKIREAKIELLF